LMNLVFDNLPEDAKADTPSLDDFIAKLKLIVGWRTRITLPAIDQQRRERANAVASYLRMIDKEIFRIIPPKMHGALLRIVEWIETLASAQETYYIPKSIAFNRMDQGEFNEFYDRCLDVIAQHFLPGVTRDELRQQVEELLK
jgi:hypothetical protein